MTDPMPVSGLILTLRDPADANAFVQELLRREPQLEPGELQGNYLPAVLETTTVHESREVHERLLDWREIISVDVVFVSADDMRPKSPTDISTQEETHG